MDNYHALFKIRHVGIQLPWESIDRKDEPVSVRFLLSISIRVKG